LSGPSQKGSLAAAALFTALAALAVFAAWSRHGASDWTEMENRLLEQRQAMMAGATLHVSTGQPEHPNSASFCGECHTLPPHPGEGVKPAFLNQHAGFLECLVCHWAGASGEQPDLIWDLPPRPVKEGEAEGAAAKKLLLKLDAPLDGSTRDLAALRDRITDRQKCFDRVPGCTQCHAKGKMARYARPGLSSKAEASLEKLPDFFTLSRGAKWYFPQKQ
jgi:hypothetical protein